MLPVPIPEQEETIAPAVEQGASGDAATNLAHEEPCTSSTMSVIDTAQGIVSPVEQRLSDNAIGNLAHMGPCIYPPTADGKACSKCQWVQLQQQELAEHYPRVHDTGNFSTTTDDAVEQTKVERHEHGDGTIAAAYKAPRNSCTSRSKNSRKRTKSRKSDVHYSGTVTMLC